MRNEVWVLVALLVLSLAASCSTEDTTTTALPTPMAPTDTLEPSTTPDPATVGATPVCPPARGEGTVPPAVSIYSIVFVVNGVEYVVRDGDTLPASPGEEVRVREVTICVGPFQGQGGEACVDFAPVDSSGQEIVSEHAGTHLVGVRPGTISMPGPDQGWTVGQDWSSMAAVLNHWPPDGTEDPGCAGGRCERDDRIIVGLR